MTNAELLAKIKAEIERRSNSTSDTTTGRELDELLSFLSTLESEHLADARKTSPKDLEEAAEEYVKKGRYLPEGWVVRPAFIAGAKWQADHAPLPEDTVLFNKGVEEGKRLMMEEMSECFAQLRQVQSDSINMSAVREQLAYNRGASDERYKMRKKMMEEAAKGEVCIPNVWVEHKEGKELVVRAEISKELGFKFGDKVRIIIVKED